MGHAKESRAGLRVFGDELDPDEITRRLGASPTKAFRKGDPDPLGRDGRQRYAHTGRWHLHADRRFPEDLNAQILEILDQVTDDLEVWRELGARYKIDMFCGVWMGHWNNGLPLFHEVLLALGQRGILLDIDLYAPPSAPPVAPSD